MIKTHAEILDLIRVQATGFRQIAGRRDLVKLIQLNLPLPLIVPDSGEPT